MSTPLYPLVVIIYIRSHMHRAEKAVSEHTCVTYPLPFNRWGAAPVSVFLCSTSLIPLQGKPFYIQDWEPQGGKTKQECSQTREHTHTNTLGKIKEVKINTLWAAFGRPPGSTVTWIHPLEESRAAIVLTFWWSKGSLTSAWSGTASSQWRRSLVLEAWTGNSTFCVAKREKMATRIYSRIYLLIEVEICGL